jgi:hypothetical protein
MTEEATVPEQQPVPDKAVRALVPWVTGRCGTCAGTGVSLRSNLDCTPCDATGLDPRFGSELARRAAEEVAPFIRAPLEAENARLREREASLVDEIVGALRRRYAELEAAHGPPNTSVEPAHEFVRRTFGADRA